MVSFRCGAPSHELTRRSNPTERHCEAEDQEASEPNSKFRDILRSQEVPLECTRNIALCASLGDPWAACFPPQGLPCHCMVSGLRSRRVVEL